MSCVYVLDTNSLRVFGNYYPDVFPSFWTELEEIVGAGLLLSCREVMKEMEHQSRFAHLNSWVDGHSGLFAAPTEKEMDLVADILRVPHFRQLIGLKQQLKGLPVADPFLVARGALLEGCVVTEEARKPQAAKVPNVCDHFQVRSTNAEGFLQEVGWRF